jgi:hypothetical protein
VGERREPHHQAEWNGDRAGQQKARRKARDADRGVAEHLAVEQQLREIRRHGPGLRQKDMVADRHRDQLPQHYQCCQRAKIEESCAVHETPVRCPGALGGDRHAGLP